MERIGWLALVLLTYGIAAFLLKIVGNRLDASSGALAIVVGYAIAGTLFGVIGGGRLGTTWPYGVAAIVGAFYIIGNWAFLRLARHEDISVLAPLTGLSIALPVILGFLLLNEAVTVRKLIGIAFAFIALVLLS